MAGTIKYDKLLKLMEEKGLSTYKIRKEKIISESTLQNIRNNGRITTDAIANLCNALDCQPGDIMEYVPEGYTTKSISELATKPESISERTLIPKTLTELAENTKK